MKLILRFLLLLSGIVGVMHAANDPADTVQRFKESLKNLDRVVLMRTEWDKTKDGDQGKIVLEIKGTEIIATLGDTIEIKEFDMECLCLESPEIHFYQGENYRFSMTLHHSQRLRGHDAVWGGDAVLTERSAERFRVWFAQHGYNGFVKDYENMLRAIAVDKARKDKFLELFPESVRSLFPTEEERFNLKVTKQKVAQFSARYVDHSALVLDCWRGLGESPHSYGQGWEREWNDFLRDILNSLAVDNLRAALECLPADESRAWIGAYRYYERPDFREENEMAKAFSEEWLARVAKRVLPLMDEYEQKWIIKNLAKRPSAATNRLLLEIAESGPLTLTKADGNSDLPSQPNLSNAVHAILALAKNQVADCRPIILRRQAEVTDAEIRLALEVALMQFDGPGAIKPAHLQSGIGEVADLAWQTVSKDPDAQVSIETLAVLAAKSESYRVRKDAAKKLQAVGLRVMTDAEKAAAILTEPRFKQAKTAAEIEALIADYKKNFANRNSNEIERRVLAALHHRKGLLLLQAGDFEKAAPLLMGGEADHELYADESFALQTLGRFNDAANSINRTVDNEEQAAVAKQLVRNGYLAFAQGEFEHASTNFSAARTVSGYLRDQGPVTLIQYLSELLSGKKPEAPSIQRMWISDSGFGESEGSPADASWPDTASFFIREKLAEADVFTRIEKQKGRKEENLCEAHFFFSVLSRVKGDAVEEKKQLQSALDTKAYTNQCFSLAKLRFRELSATKK